MYKQGEILLIPIPFTDLSSQKKRPVLVVSNDKYNEDNEDIVVSAVTSNINERDYTIIIDNNDMEEGSLKVESCIRTDKIYTLSQDIVINRFGRVKVEIFNKVKEKIDELVGGYNEIVEV